MPLNYRSVSSLTKVRPSPCLCVCLYLLERAGQRLSAVGCLLGPRVLEGGRVTGGVVGCGGLGWSCLCFQSRMAKVQHEQVMLKQPDRRLEVVSLLRCLFTLLQFVLLLLVVVVVVVFLGSPLWRMIFNLASSSGGIGRSRNQLAPQADKNN